VAAKAVEIAGTGTAGIDEGRRSTALGHFGGIDTERGAAPVDMRVKIDQPGDDQEPAHVDDVGTAAWEIAAISVTLPPPNAMSAVSSRPHAGSMTRPPLRIRSAIGLPHAKSGGAINPR
jgi:hypothetical protein